MRSTRIAVLLSALVLPGAGQMYLKHFWRGMALMLLSVACLGVLVSRVTQQASAVLDQLAAEGGAIDANHLADLAAQSAQTADNPWATIATLVLIACWVVGIVDAYRLGQRQGSARA